MLATMADDAPTPPPYDRKLVARGLAEIRRLSGCAEALLEGESDEVAALDRLWSICSIAETIADIIAPLDPRDRERLLRDMVGGDDEDDRGEALLDALHGLSEDIAAVDAEERS